MREPGALGLEPVDLGLEPDQLGRDRDVEEAGRIGRDRPVHDGPERAERCSLGHFGGRVETVVDG